MAKLKQAYETVMIFKTSLSEEETAALLERFKGIITAGGTIENVEEWGKRRLAYEIDDETEGFYVFITFESSPDVPAELGRVSNITDGVIRSLVIAREEE